MVRLGEMNTIKFIILGILILFAILLINRITDYGIQPKIIWTYWDNPDKIPKTVKMCMEGWKKFNPDYEIILLTKSNYKKYVSIPDDITSDPNFSDNPTRFADLVRVWTLAQNGGVWVDSSIVLKESLDKWLFPRPAEFSGFYIASFTKDKLPPVIEKRFFACNKGSEFVRRWRDEFSLIAKYPSVEKYVESRKEMGVNYEGIGSPVYLAMHVAAQKILQLDKYPLDSLILRKAEDGPFKYLTENGWDSEKALKFVCKNRQYQYPIMKMRGAERKVIEPKIDSDFSPESCGWLD
jgi:hypothetical protein